MCLSFSYVFFSLKRSCSFAKASTCVFQYLLEFAKTDEQRLQESKPESSGNLATLKVCTSGFESVLTDSRLAGMRVATVVSCCLVSVWV